MENISRVDSGATHGWSVRFQRDGQKHARFFYDSRYDDGAEGALKAARRWRNRMRRQLGPADAPDPRRMFTREAREVECFGVRIGADSRASRDSQMTPL